MVRRASGVSFVTAAAGAVAETLVMAAAADASFFEESRTSAVMAKPTSASAAPVPTMMPRAGADGWRTPQCGQADMRASMPRRHFRHSVMSPRRPVSPGVLSSAKHRVHREATLRTDCEHCGHLTNDMGRKLPHRRPAKRVNNGLPLSETLSADVRQRLTPCPGVAFACLFHGETR